MLPARKRWEFYHSILLALFKNLESDSKSWSKNTKFGVNETSGGTSGGGGEKWAGPFLPHPQNQVKAKYS